MSYFDRIVDHYVQHHQGDADREHRWFALQPSLYCAVEVSALAQGPSGQRLSHQYRIPARVLQESRLKLLQVLRALEISRSFEELYDQIASTILPIHGVGQLMVYDTAVRIGCYLKLYPQVVYLHAGTRIGARKLGILITGPTLDITLLPREFQRLQPSKIEDLLCIYKDWFGSAKKERDQVGSLRPLFPCTFRTGRKC